MSSVYVNFHWVRKCPFLERNIKHICDVNPSGCCFARHPPYEHLKQRVERSQVSHLDDHLIYYSVELLLNRKTKSISPISRKHLSL